MVVRVPLMYGQSVGVGFRQTNRTRINGKYLNNRYELILISEIRKKDFKRGLSKFTMSAVSDESSSYDSDSDSGSDSDSNLSDDKDNSKNRRQKQRRKQKRGQKKGRGQNEGKKLKKKMDINLFDIDSDISQPPPLQSSGDESQQLPQQQDEEQLQNQQREQIKKEEIEKDMESVGGITEAEFEQSFSVFFQFSGKHLKGMLIELIGGATIIHTSLFFP
eukprot:TRINITY_DN10563_c0_g1_i3.p2 TRINITY_DN10563_c0_g1~~TRINITY_DN10563_c0_g1_i3.p2  ORF type:complete len:219 (+),score=42.62 TRINITY_DN10563_c0_g1_i3:210-866(+)